MFVTFKLISAHQTLKSFQLFDVTKENTIIRDKSEFSVGKTIHTLDDGLL